MPTLLLALFACGTSEPPAPAPAPPAATAPAPAPTGAVVTQAKARCTLSDTCERDCTSGDALACAQLGLWAQYGLNQVPADPARAAGLQERACELGAGVGCFNLAAQRLYGVGVARDHALGTSLLVKAAENFEAACDAGGRTWCINLASMLVQGQGVDADVARGMTLLRTACAEDVPGACVQLSMVTGRNDKKARRVLLQEACSMGENPACSYLGETYLDIEPVEPKVANMWFKMGCDGGHPVGCRNLGVQHITGNGARQDAAEGLRLLEAACSDALDPDAGACHLAGITLRDGALGLMPEPARAGTLLVQACRMGQAQACVDAIALAAAGQSPVPDAAEAGQLAQMACAMGNPTACSLLRR